MDFYKQLNYSLGNEDWNVEKQALAVSKGDVILCITASGDRALHLLMTDCAKIISIDMNDTQNYLLELKLAALNQLDYDAYLAFLGIIASPHRENIFLQLQSSLSNEANKYWLANRKMISRGVIYQGKVERLTYSCAFFLNMIRRNKINNLLSFNNIEAQREYVKSSWNTFGWRKLFEILLNPQLSKLMLQDPGLNLHTDYSSQPGIYLNQRLLKYLNNHLAKFSPLLQLILIGKILPEAYFPYLTEEGYKKIRRNMSRLSYHTLNIIQYLTEQTSTTFDGFSMSDIASYMPQNDFEQLLKGIQRTANANARFCLREFMSKKQIPYQLTNTFIRDTELEKKLEYEETNFVYRFMAGKIQK